MLGILFNRNCACCCEGEHMAHSRGFEGGLPRSVRTRSPAARRGRRLRFTAHLVLWLLLATVWLPAILPTTTGSAGERVPGVFAATCALLFLFYIAYHYVSLGHALGRRVRASGTDGSQR